MKIGTKLGGGYLLVLGMVLVCSGAGFYGVTSLSNLLSFVTGPAWDTADGAMEGSIGVEAEMLGVSQVVSGLNDMMGAHQLMDEGRATADEALARMVSAGLMAPEEVEQVETQKLAFRESGQQLLEAFHTFTEADEELRDSFEAFQNLMTQAEELGDSAVEALEQQPNRLVTWNSGLGEAWSAADGGMETQIALLTRFYLYQRFIALMDADEVEEQAALRKQLNSAMTDLEEKAGEVMAHPLFKDTKIKEGEYAGQNYATGLSQALKSHKAQFERAIGDFLTFRTAVNQYNGIAGEFLETIEAVEESGDAKVEAQTETIAATQSLSFSLMVIATLTGVVLAVLIMVFVVRKIVATIKQMAEVSSRIAEGDLTVQVEVDERSSEKDELAQLNNNVATMTRALVEAIGEVATTSNHLASSAEELSSVAQETRQGVLEQQAKTDAVASAITEMSASSKEVAQSTLTAKQAADLAQKQAQDGQRVVAETIQSIGQLAQAVTSNAEVILELNQDSERIGSVLDVIQSIADQTNLLALNAAIEAARAGEQGRGFAVVADEVRTLAQRTQESTREIQEVITTLQDRTREASDAMRASQGQAQASSEKAGLAGEALSAITREVEAIAQYNAHIATAMTEQEQASEAINQSVVEIEGKSRQAVEAANQTSDSSEELARVAASMQGIVGRFRF